MSLSKHALHTDTRDGVVQQRRAKGVYVERSTVPADGTTELTFGWTGETSGAPGSVTFTINGTEHTVATEAHQDHPEFTGAEDTLTAAEPMTITIEAQGESIDIEAV